MPERVLEDVVRPKIDDTWFGSITVEGSRLEYDIIIDCRFDLWPTPEAIKQWNKAEGRVLGLFHITC